MPFYSNDYHLPSPNYSGISKGRILSEQTGKDKKLDKGIRASLSNWSWLGHSIKYLDKDNHVCYLNKNSAIHYLKRHGVENPKSLSKERILELTKQIDASNNILRVINSKERNKIQKIKKIASYFQLEAILASTPDEKKTLEFYQYLSTAYPEVIEALPTHLKNRSFLGQMFTFNLTLLDRAPNELKSDREFIKKVVVNAMRGSLSGDHFKFVPEEFRNDIEIVKLAYQIHPDILRYAGREAVIAVLKEKGDLRYASNEMKNDSELLSIAISQQYEQQLKLKEATHTELSSDRLKLIYHNLRPVKSRPSSLEGSRRHIVIKEAEFAVAHFLNQKGSLEQHEQKKLQQLQITLFKGQLVSLSKNTTQARDLVSLQCRELKAGETLLIPGGNTKHAIVYSVTRVGDTYTLDVFNTGDGIENHPTDSKGKSYALRYANLQLEQLQEDFWEELLDPTYNFLDPKYANPDVNDLYKILQNHFGKAEKGRPYTRQRMGICSDKSLGVWIHTQIVGDSSKSDRITNEHSKQAELLYKRMRRNHLSYHQNYLKQFSQTEIDQRSPAFDIKGELDKKVKGLDQTIKKFSR